MSKEHGEAPELEKVIENVRQQIEGSGIEESLLVEGIVVSQIPKKGPPPVSTPDGQPEPRNNSKP